MKESKRLLSLDTLRGFDMIFIMGGWQFFCSLPTAFPGKVSEMLAHHMHHVPWEGLTHHDTIFALFLFIAGITFPFSLAKQREHNRSEKQIYTKIITRGLILVLFGFLYNGLLHTLDFATFRYCSVLGHIGLAWMFGALIYMKLGSMARTWLSVGILIGYWVFIMYVPVPGVTEGPLTLEGNWCGYIDRSIMPNNLLKKALFDPEGLLTVIPTIVTVMLGMFTGDLLRLQRPGLTENRKVLILLFAGVVLLLIGLLWSLEFPIIKGLWSSSFVCVVGAYSILIFALFYYVIDVCGITRWTFFFKVIGVNSITIYMIQEFVNFYYTSEQIFGGVAAHLPERFGSFILSIGYIILCWLLLYFLYRKKIYLKV